MHDLVRSGTQYVLCVLPVEIGTQRALCLLPVEMSTLYLGTMCTTCRNRYKHVGTMCTICRNEYILWCI